MKIFFRRILIPFFLVMGFLGTTVATASATSPIGAWVYTDTHNPTVVVSGRFQIIGSGTYVRQFYGAVDNIDWQLWAPNLLMYVRYCGPGFCDPWHAYWLGHSHWVMVSLAQYLYLASGRYCEEVMVPGRHTQFMSCFNVHA